MDIDLSETPLSAAFRADREQPSLMPLMLDISGEPETPVPKSMPGEQCACCGLWTEKLWQGADQGSPPPMRFAPCVTWPGIWTALRRRMGFWPTCRAWP
nr:hypothetical protein pPsy0462b_00097 [Pseudomonas syringae]